MKNIFTCILIFLVSFSYNYETIKYLLRVIGDTSITWKEDFQGEEKNAESEEEPNEKNKEANFLDDLYYSNHSVSHQYGCADYKRLCSLSSQQNNNFSSSDYSQVIYSPPDVL